MTNHTEPEKDYYAEYLALISYLESAEYRNKVKVEFEKHVAWYNLTFGTNHTVKDFHNDKFR